MKKKYQPILAFVAASLMALSSTYAYAQTAAATAAAGIAKSLIAKLNPEAIQVKTKILSVGIRGTDFIVDTEDKL